MAHEDTDPVLAKSPCGSCPYRLDVPSGLWASSEYAKLPQYDLPTAQQPAAVFRCHQVNGLLCSGWAGCHDMEESLSLRVASLTEQLSAEEIDQVRDYETNVPLFATGAAAALHGMAEVAAPGPRAQKAIDKLTQRAATRRDDTG